MNDEDTYFGTVYVNFGETHQDKYKSIENLKNIIDKITGLKSEKRWEVNTDSTDINIRFNESYNRGKTNKGDFVHYPFYLEVSIKDGADWNKTFNDICQLILRLRAIGASVIPACDHEDEIETRIGKDKVNWRLSNP